MTFQRSEANRSEPRQRRGLIIVVSAPSGTGKTTVLKRFRERHPEYVYSVSATTRPPRPGEQDGKDYFFISDREFRTGIENDEFAEWAEVHGHLYGTPERFLESHVSIGDDVILDIDTQGAFQLKKKHPEAILIFLAPPSFEELERRLRSRKTEPEDVVERRLDVAKQELELKNEYDHVVVNTEIDVAVAGIEAVIEQERSRR
jgi:guanylate kinase